MTLSVSVTLATISLAPTAVFAQFPGPPPMGPGGPPPIAAGGPPAFAGSPPMGPGSVPRAGFSSTAPRLVAGAGPRGDLRALGGVRAGGRDGPAAARSVQARSAPVSDGRSGSFGHGYGGRRYGYGAAYSLEPMPAMPQAARTINLFLLRWRLLLRLGLATNAFWFGAQQTRIRAGRASPYEHCSGPAQVTLASLLLVSEGVRSPQRRDVEWTSGVASACRTGWAVDNNVERTWTQQFQHEVVNVLA